MIPPWTTGTYAPSTASTTRDQDIFAAADALARAANEMLARCAGCGCNAALAMAVKRYNDERNGKTKNETKGNN